MKKLLLLLFIPFMSFSQTPIKSGNYKTYISKDSIIINKGSKLEIGLPYNGTEYAFITQGNVPAAAHIAGSTVTITKLKAIGSKDTGYKMYAIFKGFGMLPVYVNIDQALKTEEIVLVD